MYQAKLVDLVKKCLEFNRINKTNRKHTFSGEMSS